LGADEKKVVESEMSITVDEPMVALIEASSRGGEQIFNRSLTERMMRLCERAGASRFFISCPRQEQGRILLALGRFGGDPRVQMVDSTDQIAAVANTPASATRCIAVTGNIIFSLSQLQGLIARQRGDGGGVVRLASANGEPGAAVSVGLLQDFIGSAAKPAANMTSDIPGLPFALNGRPEDRDAAERVIARTMRHDTVGTDGFMARIFDRKLSWRLSYLLAHTEITPNQVTLANTALGMGIAWMFAQPGYWIRLLGALLFVISITIDGVDGELARLKMCESEAGKRLDQITDNLVHVAIFIGISVGCYRAAHSAAYLYVLGALLAGFGLCAISVHRAMSISSAGAEAFISKVDRITGRDFAYLLLILAAINRLSFFIVGAAIGTYVFALVLWRVTSGWNRADAGALPDGGDRLAESL
jgi:phosphatidylglycerophosphate synthase